MDDLTEQLRAFADHAALGDQGRITVEEVRERAPSTAGDVLSFADSRPRGRRRAILAVAAVVVALAGVGTGIAVVAGRDRDGSEVTVAATPTRPPVRFVLGEGADRYRLASWRDTGPSDAAAVDENEVRSVPGPVMLLRRTSDGVLVRIALPFAGTGPGMQRSVEGADDEAWLRDQVGDRLDEGTFEVLGTTAVRSGHLPLGTSDGRATTFFLRQGAELVEVDVYGLGDEAAATALAGFTPRAGGGFDPPDDGSFTVVGNLATVDRQAPDPALTVVSYVEADAEDGPVVVQVVARDLLPGQDHVLLALRDLGVGTLERWGDREVLVHLDPQQDVAQASFVEDGRFVSVAGPIDDLPTLVDGLQAADAAEWADVVAEATRRLRDLPVTDSVEVRRARIEVHRAPGAEGRTAWCLTVAGSTACQTEPRTIDPDLIRADPSQAMAFSVLIDGRWWAFGRGDTRGPNDEEGASGPLEFPGQVDRGPVATPEQVERDDVWWWVWSLPNGTTAVAADVLRPPDGSGTSLEEARPAS